MNETPAFYFLEISNTIPKEGTTINIYYSKPNRIQGRVIIIQQGPESDRKIGSATLLHTFTTDISKKTKT